MVDLSSAAPLSSTPACPARASTSRAARWEAWRWHSRQADRRPTGRGTSSSRAQAHAPAEVRGAGRRHRSPAREEVRGAAAARLQHRFTGTCSAHLVRSLTGSLASSLVCFHGGFAIWLPFAILTSNLALQLERLLIVLFFVGVNSAVLDDFVCYD